MIVHLPIRMVGLRDGQLSEWLRRGLDLLFPPRCVACSCVGNWFCDACQASIEPVPEPLCSRCGRPLSMAPSCAHCRTNPTQLDGIRAVAIHKGALRQAIHHLKYRQRCEVAVPLGQLLAEYWRVADLPSVDCVVPVPLHAERQKERGYNQAALLADALAEQAGLDLDQRSLIRVRATAPQVGLGAAERKTNVQHAFGWVGDVLDGACILLVDDVCTTGATLEACAAALRRAGARSVWGLTLSRAR